MKTNSGGGRSPVQVGVKTGQKAQAKNPHFTAQIGTAIDPKAAEKCLAPEVPMSVELGNSKAARLGTGVGVGYVNSGKSGTQGTHGAANPGTTRPVKPMGQGY